MKSCFLKNKLFQILKEFVYKYILRKKYFRYGKCNRCGACCTRIYVKHQKDTVKTEKEFEILKKLHPFYTYLTVIDKDETGLVFKCSNFDPEKRICKIHKKRPGICRRYPDEVIFSMGAALDENCGFYFKPIVKFKDVLKNVGKKPVKSYMIFDK